MIVASAWPILSLVDHSKITVILLVWKVWTLITDVSYGSNLQHAMS